MDLSFSTNPPLWESVGIWLAEEAEYLVGGINGSFGKETGPATGGEELNKSTLLDYRTQDPERVPDSTRSRSIFLPHT